ncbi:MAG: uracil phosphoribosyltransferase [Flavobacteriaceae bacterium]
MIGLNIWKAIGDFCTNVLFAPYNFFKGIGDNEHWWTSNVFNLILFIIVALLTFYWFGQMAKFKKNGTEDFQ